MTERSKDVRTLPSGAVQFTQPSRWVRQRYHLLAMITRVKHLRDLERTEFSIAMSTSASSSYYRDNFHIIQRVREEAEQQLNYSFKNRKEVSWGPLNNWDRSTTYGPL